jgi:hypothetical protein
MSGGRRTWSHMVWSCFCLPWCWLPRLVVPYTRWSLYSYEFDWVIKRRPVLPKKKVRVACRPRSRNSRGRAWSDYRRAALDGEGRWRERMEALNALVEAQPDEMGWRRREVRPGGQAWLREEEKEVAAVLFCRGRGERRPCGLPGCSRLAEKACRRLSPAALLY